MYPAKCFTSLTLSPLSPCSPFTPWGPVDPAGPMSPWHAKQAKLTNAQNILLSSRLSMGAVDPGDKTLFYPAVRWDEGYSPWHPSSQLVQLSVLTRQKLCCDNCGSVFCQKCGKWFLHPWPDLQGALGVPHLLSTPVAPSVPGKSSSHKKIKEINDSKAAHSKEQSFLILLFTRRSMIKKNIDLFFCVFLITFIPSEVRLRKLHNAAQSPWQQFCRGPHPPKEVRQTGSP